MTNFSAFIVPQHTEIAILFNNFLDMIIIKK